VAAEVPDDKFELLQIDLHPDSSSADESQFSELNNLVPQKFQRLSWIISSDA
jgi:hypothetical protein